MTAIAARLDPCVNWFKLVARTHDRVLWIFPGLLLFGYLASLSRTNALQGFVAQASLRRANAPLVAEARRLGLDYDAVAAAPEASVGKPVIWCVESNDGRSGFVETRENQPVVWTEPSRELQTNNGSHGYCWSVLAVVQGVDRGVVRLRPVERL